MIFVSMKNIMERPCSRQDFSRYGRRRRSSSSSSEPLMLLIWPTPNDVAELELCNPDRKFLPESYPEVAACGKHFDTEALAIDARNGTERFRCGAVQHGTGRRTEHERIGQNGAAQKTRNLRRNLKALFFINGIDDGRRAADGLVAEIHRRHRLEGADAVVVDDFKISAFSIFSTA